MVCVRFCENPISETQVKNQKQICTKINGVDNYLFFILMIFLILDKDDQIQRTFEILINQYFYDNPIYNELFKRI